MLNEHHGARDNDPDDNQTDQESLIDSIESYLSYEPAEEVDLVPFEGSDDEINALRHLQDQVEAGVSKVTEFPPEDGEEWFKIIGFTDKQQLLLSSMRTILRGRRAQGTDAKMLDDRIKQEGQQLADDIEMQGLYELRQAYQMSEFWCKPLDVSDETFGKN